MIEAFRGFLENLGYRFLLSALAPAVLLVGGTTVLLASLGEPGAAANPGWWSGKAAELAGSVAYWVTAVLVALGAIVLNRLVIQVWEGYPWLALRRRWRRLTGKPALEGLVEWTERAQCLGGEMRTALMDQQRDGTDEDLTLLRRAVARRWLRGALEAPVDLPLPTALGRLLRRMEVAPYQRYGMEPISTWSRIQREAPAELLDQYRIGKTWLDLSLNLATTLVLLFLPAAAWAWESILSRWALPALCLLLAYLLYRTALPSAQVMRLAFEAVFDHHRGALLERWGLEQPPTIAAERALWRQLQSFLHFSDPYLFPEEHRRAPRTPEPEHHVVEVRWSEGERDS